MRNTLTQVFAILSLLLFCAEKAAGQPNNESYRPQFHFTPAQNWMNDPNGLLYFDGEYHLFYQHNPLGNEWGFMNWGHAVSTDLLHWEHLPIAITPDEDSRDKERCTAWSGSALVDERNLTGLQQGDQPALLIFYTSYQCGQRLAYSTDKGRTWLKYEGNPLIPFDEKDDARDPKVFWHEPSQKYVMLLWRKPDGDERSQGISFYNSSDLINWQFQSHLPGFYECPDLVELPVNRRPDEKRWVIFDGDGSYHIGQFDGTHFTPETIKLKSDFGANYYATQTWNNLPEADGRTIQIAWMRGANFPDMPFNGQMGFPCELSLKTYLDGMYLLRNPVKEIELLHEKGFAFEDKNLIPGLNQNLVKKVKGDCLHIIGTFNLKTVSSFGFLVRHSKKETGTEIRYDATKNTLSCLGQAATLAPEDGKIKLEILLDRASIEIFGNDGKMVMTNSFTPEAEATELVLYNTGGELLVEKLEIYPLKSIYEQEP
ncbi:glycoside hydrolase family 32 protein [Gaoshiqia sediminis]|uniref:Glycoside hydrolase family 32 protein n=1 Tax=Gaoshiqia sediminis TaxID=2986998 RepID=A0AA42C620_9BACT|nr:glycoside hydrolase family 32 protein [Gaoshiqia sediminis]MCW0483453.1 glycoside hydrolase family 32 protein [Gaoshiqia sediminis]